MKKGGKTILVFNVGSSSIKYSLFKNLDLEKSGNYERLKTKEDYKKSIDKIFDEINENIDLFVHRIVHGGNLKKPLRITQKAKNNIKKFSELAPLHNIPELMVINFCEKYKKPQYAVFDTMFFSNLPEVSKTYAIPNKLTKKYDIKRYGFHGLSHESVSRNMKGKTITCHLGAGSSISAILNGKPIDTTMGFTPLEGVIMTTRSGSIDPGIIFFLEKKGYNVEKLLTNESGLKGICGYSDFRDVRKNLNRKDCKLAYNMFMLSIIKTISSYIGVLNGLDNLIFTGAIGENVQGLRKEVCNCLSFIGIKIDKKKNKSNSEIISSKKSKIKVWVKKANEEKMAVKSVLKIL